MKNFPKEHLIMHGKRFFERLRSFQFIIHNSSFIILAIAFCAMAGCRREDMREVTLDIPGLNATNEVAVADAIKRFGGVDRRSIRFDQAKKTVTLKYDSMKLAHTNLRMAIEEKGVKVAFPENTSGMAGYINER